MPSAEIKRTYACSGAGPCVGLAVRLRVAGVTSAGQPAMEGDADSGSERAAGGEFVVWAGGQTLRVLDTSSGSLEAHRHDRPLTALSVASQGTAVTVGDSLGRLIEIEALKPGRSGTAGSEKSSSAPSEKSSSLAIQVARSH